jgi:hypothetical protein
MMEEPVPQGQKSELKPDQLNPDTDTQQTPFSFSIPDIPVLPSHSFSGASCPDCLISESVPPLWLPLCISGEAGHTVATLSRTVKLETIKPGLHPSIMRKSNAVMSSLQLHNDLIGSSNRNMYRASEPQQAASSPASYVEAQATGSGRSPTAGIHQHLGGGRMYSNDDVGLRTVSRQLISSALPGGSPFISYQDRAGRQGVTITTAVHWGSDLNPNISVTHEDLNGIRWGR